MEALEEAEGEWPSPSPTPGDHGPPALPDECREFFPDMDDFWNLPKLPVGCVLTFTLPHRDGGQPEATFAVLALTVTRGEEGMSLAVKFLGASEEWAKQYGSQTFNRQKKKVHICLVEPRRCQEEAAVHLSTFFYYPPGQFSAGYVEKRVMKEMEKFLEIQRAKATPVPPEKADGPPRERENPGEVDDRGYQPAGTERLARLREKLVGNKSAPALGGGGAVRFNPAPTVIPQRQSALRNPVEKRERQAEPEVISSGTESELPQVKSEEPVRKKKKETVGTALLKAVQEKSTGASSSRALVTYQPPQENAEQKGVAKKKKKKKSKKKKKKDKKASSSSSDYGYESSSSEILPPLQKKAERKPGSVLKMLMDHVMKSLSDASVLGAGDRGTAASAVNSPARVQSYFQVLVRSHLSQRPRDEKELHSLAIALDALRDGDLERLADLLAGRYLAVETAVWRATGTRRSGWK